MIQCAKMFGRLVIMVFFVICKEPSALWMVLLMPTIIMIFGYLRGDGIATGRRERDKRERELIGTISQTCEKYSTIKHYFRSSQREELYRRKAENTRAADVPVHVVMNNNLYSAMWLGPIFIGVYVCATAHQVLSGEVKLGFFLATISILQDMSALFLEVYKYYQKITEIAEPLMTLTVYYNLG